MYFDRKKPTLLTTKYYASDLELNRITIVRSNTLRALSNLRILWVTGLYLEPVIVD